MGGGRGGWRLPWWLLEGEGLKVVGSGFAGSKARSLGWRRETGSELGRRDGGRMEVEDVRTEEKKKERGERLKRRKTMNATVLPKMMHSYKKMAHFYKKMMHS